VLQEKSFDNLKSETLYFPNVSSLMKISLGLILFTMISTVLVYAQTSSDDAVVQIIDGAYLEDNVQRFDNALFSSSPGATITVVNNDSVSHTFVSGNSNSNNEGKINYDTFLLCELNEKVTPTNNNYGLDDNLCDFNKDNRIITDIIPPGDSVSFSLTEIGTYRIIDPDYPWMEFVIYSFPDSESANVNSGFPEIEKIPQEIPASEPALTPFIETLSVTVNGMPFDVEYTGIGLSVYEIESDTDSMSLIFYVNVDDSTGTLNITFDRVFFDSIYDGEDDSFFVLADGDETVSREIQTTVNSRTLTIEIPSGTEELEIIGSVFGITTELPSVIETPVIETPVIETPVIETPVIETPVIETPVIETPPTNECGPGTVLENDVCVIDQRCGPGTVLENDVCVIDSTPTKSSSSGNNKELIMGIAVAFVIAGVIGIIFAIISKANRNKH
jgi:plastocyanin